MAGPVQSNQVTQNTLQDPQGIYEHFVNWFQQRGINPFQNRWAQQALKRTKEASALQNVFDVKDADRESYLNNYMNGLWNGSGTGVPNRAGIQAQVQRSLADPNSDANAWLNAGGDFGAQADRWLQIQGLESRGSTNQIAEARDALAQQKIGSLSAYTRANPEYKGSFWDLAGSPMAQNPWTPPGQTAAPPAAPPLGQTPAPTAPALPQIPTTPPAASPTPPSVTPSPAPPTTTTPQPYGGFSPERGVVNGKPALVFKNWGDLVANAQNHPTAPGKSSMILPSGWQYDAPADTDRRYWVAGSTGTEPGGQKKGSSGWKLLTDWIGNFTRNNPNVSPEQAFNAAMAMMLNRVGGDPAKLAKFGFTRRAA